MSNNHSRRAFLARGAGLAAGAAGGMPAASAADDVD